MKRGSLQHFLESKRQLESNGSIRQKNVKGDVERYKARLIAQGYCQKPGIDYDEVFAPVVHLETIRLIISLAAQNG